MRWGKAPVADVDWRSQATPEDLAEYDAFGPWIDPVRTAADMPRAFRGWYDRLAGHRFLLKVPRDVERATARPGQDLYQAVLAVGEDGITLLQLGSDGVADFHTPWSGVVGVRNYLNLLLARWTVLLADGDVIDLDYNAVGVTRMAEVTDYLRARLAALPAERRTPDPAVPVAVKDDLLKNRLAQLTRSVPDAVALHADPKNRLCRAPSGRRGLSTGSLLVDLPGELVIITRGEPVSSPFLANYAASQTHLAYGALQGFSVADASGRSSFGTLRLRAGRTEIAQPWLNRPDAACAALLARGVPELTS